MRWICFVLLALSATTTISSAKDEDNSNEIAPPRPPINLDSNLRRALLKALTELENEENQKINQQEDSSSTFRLPHLDTSDKIVEKASASALSFYASTGGPSSSTTSSSFDDEGSSTTESATLQPLVFIQRSNGFQHKPITTVEATDHRIDGFNEAEQILTSASSSFTSSSAFRKSVAQTPNRNLVTPEIKSPKIANKVETTTATTTTTSTEESQAKVEDVQFFSAPLVAAFTVHQDERGLPKSVEPIYRQLQKVENAARLQNRSNNKVATTSTTTTSTTESTLLNYTPLVAHQEQLRQQFALQQKQKSLEDEIFRLKQQQQQQNYLIRQQQFLNEQQLQIQRQKLLDEQIRIRNNQQAFTPINSPNFNSFENNLNRVRNDFNSNNSRIKGSLVSFQPSITLNANEQVGTLPLNAQQLPIKNAVDFRSNNLNGDFNQQSNFFRQPISITQSPPLVSSPSNFNFAHQNVEPAQTLTAPRHNRVFRQESDTGNFFNNNNAGFNGNYFNNIPQQHRFFRSNFETFPSPYSNFNRQQPPAVNHQLNNLLYNSGVITKQHEDLNIISKVLSLNHLGGEHHNQRYAASSVSEQRIPYVKTV